MSLLGLVLLEYVLGYWVINHFSAGRPAHSLETGLDRAIPLVVPWVFVYVLAIPACVAPALLTTDRARFRTVCASYSAALILSALTFLVYPVTVPRPPLPGHGIGLGVLALTWRLDPPYNCFPSLHVGLDVLAAAGCSGSPRSWVMVLWVLAGLISISTVLVKQHYVLDVLGGLFLAWFALRVAQHPWMLRLTGGARL